MAWQGPAFGVRHHLREIAAADVADLTIDTGTAAAGHGLEFAYDDSAGTLFRTVAAGTLRVDIDRGSADSALDALYIPKGHNLRSEVTVKVIHALESAFASAVTLGEGSPDDSGAAFLLPFDAPTRRYVRVEFTESSFAGSYYDVPQMIITNMARPTIAESAGRWGSAKAASVDTLLESGATARVNHSPPLRTWEYDFPFVSDADEIAALDLVAATSPAAPVVFDHPYSTDATGTAQPALLARILRAERKLFRPAPGDLAASYRFTLAEYAG